MASSTITGPLFDGSTNETLRSTLPEPVIAFLEVATHLGDGVTLIVLATLLYWFGAESRRRTRALVIAIGLAALAISAGLKGIVASPRPELAFTPAGYPGYSFPSAHALGAAAFYGALAAVSTIGTRRQRFAIAGAIVGTVALSRVVIGVHYLGDVIAGVALGLALVAVVLMTDDRDPGIVFATAIPIAIGAFLLGSQEFTTLTIGAGIGATVAWLVVKDRHWNPYGASMLVLGVFCLPVVVTFRVVSFEIGFHWTVEIVSYAVATGAIIIVPAIAHRLNGWFVVECLQSRLPFRGRTIDPEKLSR